jgi:hypothetical protein
MSIGRVLARCGSSTCLDDGGENVYHLGLWFNLEDMKSCSLYSFLVETVLIK